jgi:2-amino-4-hydroxy-6-hydroxymethyldihydropteridine diphosphokinase
MIAIVALGSNLGDRRSNLDAGLEALRDLGIVKASPKVMETPDENGIGPAYLNTVARLDTFAEDPLRLMEELLRIELRLGRDRRAGFGAPRTLDLDLVQVEGVEGTWIWTAPPDLRVLGDTLSLVLPHPRACHRCFVMLPLEALRASIWVE